MLVSVSVSVSVSGPGFVSRCMSMSMSRSVYVCNRVIVIERLCSGCDFGLVFGIRLRGFGSRGTY